MCLQPMSWILAHSLVRILLALHAIVDLLVLRVADTDVPVQKRAYRQLCFLQNVFRNVHLPRKALELHAPVVVDFGLYHQARNQTSLNRVPGNLAEFADLPEEHETAQKNFRFQLRLPVRAKYNFVVNMLRGQLEAFVFVKLLGQLLLPVRLVEHQFHN